MKNIKELAKYIARIEGGKKQINIAQITEVLRILSDRAWVEPKILEMIHQNGRRRAKKNPPIV
jgi:hypothetical protein